MKNDYANLLSFEFVPLSEVKSKLSEQVRKTTEKSKRVAITVNGKPAAVLLSYPDYLGLLQATPAPQQDSPERVIDFAEWKRGNKTRRKISDSINQLFNPSTLSRKGQKSYKRAKVREFNP